MPSARTRQHHTHQWTAFEHHALLCLICRQIPITGLPRTPTPTTTPTSIPPPPTTAKPTPTTSQRTRFRGGKRRKTAAAAVVELSKSLRHTHRDVADALNRALNFANQERDIPVEEVSAMIAQLMEERPLAVAYLERQRTNRVTRSMRRVWERAGMVSGCRGGGGGGGGGGTSAGGDAASAGGVAGCGGDRGLDSTDVGGGDGDDPWGDNAAKSLVETQPDPWGDDVATSLVETEMDPWGEEVAAYLNEAQKDPWGEDGAVGTAVESRDAAEARSPIQADTTMFDAKDDIDPWGSHETTTQDNDPADPWGDTVTPSANNSTNPSIDPSSQFESPSSPALLNSSSQAQSTASVSVTTAPQASRFTGINSERLAMLESTAERQDETVHEPMMTTHIPRGKGGNAVELPFNRIESMISGKRDAGTANESTLDAGNDESDVSEEE